MNAEQIERTVLTIIDSFDGRLPSEQLQEMRALAKAGECGVALENLCTQLYEYDVVVSPDTVAQIREAGQAMVIAAEHWKRLAVKKPQ